jgi:hypothetical protein
MIIKSKSRANKSFKSLYEYMSKDKSEMHAHNLYSNAMDKEAVIKEFMENAKELDNARGKNYLYHEIISLEKDLNLSDKRKKEILLDLSKEYINKRAKDHLVISAVHTDKEHTHIHLMISANKVASKRRERVSKHMFNRFQRETEDYKNSKYPFLSTEFYKQAYQEANKEPLKDRVKKRLAELFKSETQREFVKGLEQENIKLKKRGKNISVEMEGRTFRLKTLGKELDTAYRQMVDNFKDWEQTREETRAKKRDKSRTHKDKNNQQQTEQPNFSNSNNDTKESSNSRYPPNYRDFLNKNINKRENELNKESKEQSKTKDSGLEK